MSARKPLNRAEAVRQRRKRAEERALVTQSMERPTHRRATASTPSVPVTTRNVSVDAATVRATPKPVRQYQALAAAPARTLHAPTMPRVRLGWRLLSFFLVVLLSAAAYFAYTDPMFQISGVALSGNQYLGVDEVNSVLGLSGMPIFLLEPAKVEKALRLNFPEISSVKVTVDLPNIVNVTITERQPVIRWEQGNAFTWLDAEGVALRPRAEVSGLVVIRASGAAPTGPASASDPLAPIPFVAPEIVQTARVLAPYAPQGAALLYDPKFGIGWTDNRGWTVWFGASPDQADMKLRVYVVLVNSLAQRGITPVMIDVAYPDAPYYRLGQ